MDNPVTRPITPERAIEAVRHVIQDHGDSQSNIGGPADLDKATWIGELLGIAMPRSYLTLIGKHDGACLDQPIFGLMESFDSFAIHRQAWGPPRRFWPVGGDGCGNYYVLATLERSEAGECPVAFIEATSSLEKPYYWVASSFDHFVFFHMTRECARQGCTRLIESPNVQAWPYDPDFVLSLDPELSQWQPRDRWPK